jgi:hypothetical protein
MSPFFIALTVTNVLLLALLIAPRLRWWAKLGAIVLVLGLNFLSWSSVNSGRGWAVPEALPDPGQYVSCVVVEPNIATGTVGVIYVEMIPLDFKHGVLSYRPNTMEPRLYRLPYDRSLHESCEAAKKAAAQGVPVTIRKAGKAKPHGTDHNSGRFHPYVLPSPQLPRKGQS